MQNDCEIFFSGGSLEAGQQAESWICLLVPDLQKGRLFVGLRFTLYEGPVQLGTGEITAVDNPALQVNG